MHKKFEINQTKIKGGCQSGRKVVTHDSKSDLPLPTRKRQSVKTISICINFITSSFVESYTAHSSINFGLSKLLLRRDTYHIVLKKAILKMHKSKKCNKAIKSLHKLVEICCHIFKHKYVAFSLNMTLLTYLYI